MTAITACEGVADFTSRLARSESRSCIAGCFYRDPLAAHMPFGMTMLRQDVETMVDETFAALGIAQQEEKPLVTVSPILVPKIAAEPRASRALCRVAGSNGGLMQATSGVGDEVGSARLIGFPDLPGRGEFRGGVGSSRQAVRRMAGSLRRGEHATL